MGPGVGGVSLEKGWGQSPRHPVGPLVSLGGKEEMRWDRGTDLSAGICRSFWKLQGSEDRAEVKGHSAHPCPAATQH